MREDLEHIAKIDAYLNGALSPEDTELFEDRMFRGDFRQEVALQQEINNLVIIEELYKLDKQVKNYKFKDHTLQKSSVKSNLISIIGLLLLIMDVLIIGLVNIQKFNGGEDLEKINNFSYNDTLKFTPSFPESDSSIELPKENGKPLSGYKKASEVFFIESDPSLDSTVKQTKPKEIVKHDSLYVTIKKDTAVLNLKPEKPIQISNLNQEPVPVVDTAKIDVLENNPLPDNDTSYKDPEPFFQEKKNYDLAFSPSRGQLLEWPVENDFKGIIRVYDLNGRIILEENFKRYGDIQWNGITNDGQLISVGVYPFIINTENGSFLIEGSITIID